MVSAKMLTILVAAAAVLAGTLLWESDQASAEDTGTAASVENGITGNCTWTLEDQVLKIIGATTTEGEPNGNMDDYESKGAPWYGKTIKEVYLECVIYVGEYAFQDCIDIESVNSAAVKAIGKYAFSGCTALKNVEIGGSVGEYAFSGCSSLKNVFIMSGSEDSIGSYAFSGCVYLNLIRFKGSSGPVLKENSLNLSNVEPLTVIIAAENPAYITASATGTKTSVVFDAGEKIPVEITGTYVYSGSEITLPDSEFEFYDETSMVISGNKATEVGTYIAKVGLKDGYVWSDGTRTPVTAEWTIIRNAGVNVGWTLDGTELTLTGSGVTADYDSENPAPWGTAITKVIIGSGITGLGSYLFAGCTALDTVEFNSDMVSLGEGVFSGCISLISLDIHGFTASVPDRMFEGCTSLESVVLPDSCTSIGAYAFSGCIVLNSITFPETVTSIGEGAFADCTALTALVIPSSVTSLGQSAFARCTGLKELTVPIALDAAVSATNPAFAECASIEKITFIAGNGSDYIAETAAVAPWNLSTALKEVVLSDGVLSIGSFMFSGCTALSAISIPTSVTEIGESSFSGCTGLTEIVIPDAVAVLGQSAFAGCTGLKELTLPISLNAAVSTTAPAFGECDSIEKIIFVGTAGCDYSADLAAVTPWRISTSLNETVLSDGATSIGNYMFYGCTALKTITIPSTVTSVGDQAFAGCSKLTFVVFKGTPTLGTDSFKLFDSEFTLAVSVLDGYLNKVKDTDVVGSVAKILNAVVTKPTVLSEKVCAYSDGGSSTVTIDELFSCYDGVTMNCSGPLTGSAEGSYNVTLGLKDSFAWSDGTWGDIGTSWWILKNMFKGTSCYWYLNGTELVIAGSGVMKDFDYNTRPSKTLSWQNIESVSIKFGVTNVGKYAFYGCSKLVSVTFSETVTVIGECSFSQSGLKEIEIPGTVKTIGDSAFSLCDSLRTVNLNNGLEYVLGSAFYGCSSLLQIVLPASVTSLGGQAFLNCSALETAYLKDVKITELPYETFLNCTSLKTVKLPDGLISMGASAFQNTALTDIEIPDSVSSMGLSAFEGCTYLTGIDLSKTKISKIGISTFLGCTALKSVLLPDTVNSIDDHAFSGCSALASIDLGKTAIKIISNEAFYKCSALSTAILPAGLEEISDSAFNGTGLIKITIPAAVNEICRDAFCDCSSLKFIRFDGSSENLGDNCFKTGTTSILISALDELYNKLSDDKEVYFGNDTITLQRAPVKPTLSESEYTYTGSEISVNINGLDKSTMQVVSGDKGTDLDSYTLVIKLTDTGGCWSDGTTDNVELQWKISPITGNCTWSLNGTELTISGTGAMGDYSATSKAPWGTEITKLIISEGVTSVGAYAFANCVDLSSVTIPSSVVSIGESAFSGCSGLKSVDFKCATVTFGNSSFELSSSEECELLVYGSVVLDSKATGSNVSVRSAVLDKGSLSVSKTYAYTGSVITVPEIDITGFDSTKMVLSENTSSKPGSNTLYIEPASGYAWSDGTIDKIGLKWYSDNSTGDCFWEVDGTALKITGSGKTGNYSASSPAPWGTGIISVTFSDGVTYLGRYAFAGCTSLTEVTVPAGVVGIGDNCFSGCSSLVKATFNGTPAFGTNSLCLSTSDSITLLAYGPADPRIPSTATGDKVAARYVVDTISRSSISVSGTYHVNGSEITVPIKNISGFSSDYMQVSGNTAAAVGTYTLTVFLKDGYAWSDGTWDSVSASWTISEHLPVTDPAIPGSCTGTGRTEGQHCSGCGAILVPQMEISALGHTYGTASYTWSDDLKCTASMKCTRDGCSNTVEETVSSVKAVITTPTCDNKGSDRYTATFKNSAFKTQTKDVDTNALGHTYGTASYTWSDDLSACVATRICAVCNHAVTEEVAVTPVVSIEPSCTADGLKTYSAAFTKEGFTVQTQTSAISALGHITEQVAEISATSSVYGTKAHWHCSECNKNFSDESGTIEVSDEELRIPKTEEGGSNTIAIVAVGVIAVVGALGAAVFFLRRR